MHIYLHPVMIQHPVLIIHPNPNLNGGLIKLCMKNYSRHKMMDVTINPYPNPT